MRIADTPIEQMFCCAGAPSRRRFIRGAGASVLATGATILGGRFGGVAAQERRQPTELADAIYSGGPILTMDDQRPRAEAIAIRSGRIVTVGSRDEVEHLADAGTRRIDLGGRTLLPGFFDAHGHVTMVGLQALSANLLPAPDGEGNSITDLLRIVHDWMTRNTCTIERYKLIGGFGYDDSQLRERRHPTRQDLDQLSTDIPVLLIHQSGHLGAANSKALEIVGINAETPDPSGGVIRREPGSREPNGVLEEQAFFAMLGALFTRLDLDANLAMLKAGAEFYARFGYTTCQEARASEGSVAIMQLAARQGALPIDVLAYPDILSSVDVVKAPTWGRDYHDRFRIGGVKLTIDGSPQGKTAWLSQPYLVPPEGQSLAYAGYPAIPNDVTMEAVDRAFANGWQILVHANGDAAIDVFLAAVRAAAKKHGQADRRTVLIHGQTAREDQVDAMRELDVIPSFFPMHTFYWGDWHRDSVLGPVRAENISPCGWALRRGMLFTSHHDAPVANPDAMRVLSATVTRRTRSGDILGPHQRVPVEIALKAMTLWAAYQHFEESHKGSIEAGKLADFVVLSEDPTRVDPEKLSSLTVTETIKEGVSVLRQS